MHEQTRKFILLLIFFLFGPLLTLGIGTAIVLRQLPSNAVQQEYELSKQTGIHWTVQRVEHRSPGSVRLKNVRMIDSSANDAADQSTIFFAPQIDIKCYTADQRELSKLFSGIDVKKQDNAGLLDALFYAAHRHRYYQVTVPASLLTLERYSADAAEAVLHETLSRLLQRLPFLSQTPMLFALEDCLIQRPEAAPNDLPIHFRDIKGNLYHTAKEILSDWTFQLPPELEIQKFSIVKQRNGNGTEFTLRTGKRTIPCEVAGIFSPFFRQLGSDARFSGTFTVESGTPSSALRMESAVWRNIDLASLAAGYSPFPMTGTIADLQIHEAVFGAGMFSATGCTQIIDGTLDRTLFCRLTDHFRLSVHPQEESESPESSVAFDGCAVHFKLQPDGISFWGDEQWEGGKLLMYRKGDGLRTQPMYIQLLDAKSPLISYYSVLSLFAPDDAPVVPLTPGLQRLVGSLPVMDSVPQRQNPQPFSPAAVAPMVAQPK